jgi:hypothetical protein
VGFLAKGNTKLGPLVQSWSIPAIQTCPGASALCKKLCYATRGFYNMANVIASLEKNLELARSKEFVPVIVAELREKQTTICRVHCAGDFFNRRYIRQWLAIVSQRRQTTFYAYTRSWRKPELLPDLVELGRQPNMQLWFSWDRTMPFPPRRMGIRTCYLSLNDDDLPSRRTDLVFREKDETVLKHTANGSLVCPYENGVTPIGCSRCKICWTPKKGTKHAAVTVSAANHR